MNNSLPKNEELINTKLGKSLLEAHKYWTKKRLLFNMLVGVAGVVSIILFSKLLFLFDYIGILMWGMVANGLFSFGYVLECTIITNSNGLKNIVKYRNLLFWIGTLTYIFTTFSFAKEYFSNSLLGF